MSTEAETVAAGQAVMAAVKTVAQTDWDASTIVNRIESIRQDTGDDEVSTKELRLLAMTAMESEEIAASVFFIRDGHNQGIPLKCHGPPGLMGAALGDFVYDKQTGTMRMVPFPGDIAHINPLGALKLAIQLNYVRTMKGVWKDSANFK